MRSCRSSANSKRQVDLFAGLPRQADDEVHEERDVGRLSPLRDPGDLSEVQILLNDFAHHTLHAALGADAQRGDPPPQRVDLSVAQMIGPEPVGDLELQVALLHQLEQRIKMSRACVGEFVEHVDSAGTEGDQLVEVSGHARAGQPTLSLRGAGGEPRIRGAMDAPIGAATRRQQRQRSAVDGEGPARATERGHHAIVQGKARLDLDGVPRRQRQRVEIRRLRSDDDLGRGGPPVGQSADQIGQDGFGLVAQEHVDLGVGRQHFGAVDIEVVLAALVEIGEHRRTFRVPLSDEREHLGQRRVPGGWPMEGRRRHHEDVRCRKLSDPRADGEQVGVECARDRGGQRVDHGHVVSGLSERGGRRERPEVGEKWVVDEIAGHHQGREDDRDLRHDPASVAWMPAREREALDLGRGGGRYRESMRPRAVVVSLLVVTATAPTALAVENDWEGNFGIEAERRSDFTAGLSVGVLAGTAYGYPNEASKIGNDRYVADTGVGVGSAQTLWIGGALRDWFTFAVGYWNVGYSANALDASGFGVLFRVETFPLWSQGGVWRDVGLYGDFGLGGMTLKSGDETHADGGALSILGVGAFWEPVRFGIFSFGPNVEFMHLYSQTLTMSSATVGARLAIYTGP